MVAWNSFTNVYEVAYTATAAGPLAVSVSINGLFLTELEDCRVRRTT